MFTFRKALIVAAFILTFIYLFKTSHTTTPSVSTQDTTEGRRPVTDPASYPTATGKAAYKPSQSGRLYPPPTASRKKKPTQQPLTDIAGKPLREQLQYQFPYDVEGKFPAYIWQTWRYTPASGKFEEDFRPAEASWTEAHPGFVHEVITDEVAVHLIRHLYASVPSVLEAYRALPLPVLKADFFRYLVLLARGGIYTDIDTFALKSATEWIPAEVPRASIGLIIGIEADPDREDWRDWYSRRIQFVQWTIQSKPGHPVLRDIVATITEDTLRMKKAGVLKSGKLDKSVVEFTGPAVWTDAIFRYFNSPEHFEMERSKGNISFEHFMGMKTPKKVGDVVVLPITCFSPGVQQMGAGEPDDPMAFVKHDFKGMSHHPERPCPFGKC
jgi:alpha 1,6-mannosyltransferase